MSSLQEDIKNGQFKNAYLLYGEEAYLRNFYKNELKSKLTTPGDNLNFSYYEGASTSPDEVAGILSTMPFMADYRVVIVENSGWMAKASGDGDDSGESKGSGKLEGLINTVSALDENVVFILVEEKADKRSKLFKTIASKGVCEECAKATPEYLARWCSVYCKNAGKAMSGSTASYLVGQVGDDMTLLSTELEKLISFALERNEITVNDINEICTAQINDRIFDMIDAVSAHRREAALNMYYDLLKLRESPFHILVLLQKQYERMIVVKDMLNHNRSSAEMAEKLSIQPWLVKRVTESVRQTSVSRIKKCLEAIAKCDGDIKSGNLSDTMSIELLLIECSK